MKVAAIVGATATGKTEVSVAVAEALDAEIVSIDSMQAYRGMDIGTAKATEKERARASHHLLDLFDPADDVTVQDYQEAARGAISDIVGRGKLPLLVGGSGLYFRAVVDDLRFPPRRPEIRAALEEVAEKLGPEALHARLTELDAAAAARIEPANARRTVRALEVIEITGRPFSDNDAWDRYESIYELSVAGLRLERSELYRRIEARVQEMLDEGLVEEAEAAAAAGMGRTARQALGYRQVLDAPGASRPELAVAIAGATKRFARRQESWFRSDPRVVWFWASDPSLAEVLVAFFRTSLRVA
jgi:tRNA dimethylallyltransferase